MTEKQFETKLYRRKVGTRFTYYSADKLLIKINDCCNEDLFNEDIKHIIMSSVITLMSVKSDAIEVLVDSTAGRVKFFSSNLASTNNRDPWITLPLTIFEELYTEINL